MSLVSLFTKHKMMFAIIVIQIYSLGLDLIYPFNLGDSNAWENLLELAKFGDEKTSPQQAIRSLHTNNSNNGHQQERGVGTIEEEEDDLFSDEETKSRMWACLGPNKKLTNNSYSIF